MPDLVVSRFASATANGKSCGGVPVNEFGREKVDKSVAELKEEKLLVAELFRN